MNAAGKQLAIFNLHQVDYFITTKIKNCNLKNLTFQGLRLIYGNKTGYCPDASNL